MCTKRIRRVIWRAILYSFPFIILAVVGGIVDGVLFSKYLTATISSSLSELADNIAHGEAQQLSHVWTSAEPQIQPPGPFHVPEIRDPRGWWEKLGLVRPNLD